MSKQSTIDEQELTKFAQHAAYWWDKQGPLRTLHDINDTRLDFISQYVDLSGLKVLDVGCGGGILCEALAKAGAQVTGLDAESHAIEAAKDHANQQQLVIEYQCSPLEEFESEAFDVVTCMEMLEHVQNPELILEHCQRLVKPEGMLFLSTINRTAKAYATVIIAAEYILGLLPKQTHDYKKFIKPSELVAMSRGFDFELLDMKGLQYNPISRQAFLNSDVQVNYLLAMRG